MFGREWGDTTSFGFLFALVLALWAIFSIAQSRTSDTFGKALWCVIVLFIPFFGFAAWLFWGPKAPPKIEN